MARGGKDYAGEYESKDKTEMVQEGHGTVKIILRSIVVTGSARPPDTFVPHALFHIPLGLRNVAFSGDVVHGLAANVLSPL